MSHKDKLQTFYEFLGIGQDEQGEQNATSVTLDDITNLGIRVIDVFHVTLV